MTDTFTEERPAPPQFEAPPEEIHARATAAGLPVVANPSFKFMPVADAELQGVAVMMAHGGPMVPPQFQVEIVGEAKAIGRCKAVAYQAARWGMDPIAVCQKAYVTVSDAKGPDGKVLVGGDNKPIKAERIGYEAQLVHALILAFAPIRGLPRMTYGYQDPDRKIAALRYCHVEITMISGQVIPLTTPTVAQIKVKNSPLWYSDPDQQLSYYAMRAMGRRHFPHVLMGVYTIDELQQVAIRDVTNRRSDFEEDETAAEPVDAVFEDGIETTPEDVALHGRWEKKASGEGDSRDPRDAPANAATTGPNAPPESHTRADPPPRQEGHEYPEAQADRLWLAEQQTRVQAMTKLAPAGSAWNITITKDKRWGRLKSYQPDIAQAARRAIEAHIARLKAAEASGADPETGEVQ